MSKTAPQRGRGPPSLGPRQECANRTIPVGFNAASARDHERPGATDRSARDCRRCRSAHAASRSATGRRGGRGNRPRLSRRASRHSHSCIDKSDWIRTRAPSRATDGFWLPQPGNNRFRTTAKLPKGFAEHSLVPWRAESVPGDLDISRRCRVWAKRSCRTYWALRRASSRRAKLPA